MRICFIGAVKLSECLLARLLKLDVDVVGVCTVRESIYNSDHCDLSILCKCHNIPWIYAEDINCSRTLDWLRQKTPDVILCFGWSTLIRAPLLNLAPLGVIGYHPAPIPANRGRHPIIWALALGLEETASTFFFMDEGADSGDILSQESIAIDKNDNAATLYEKITRCALQQIDTFVPQLVSEKFPRFCQDHQRANIWRKRVKTDGQIDWRMSATSIHNLVRALTKPYVGAHFLHHGAEFKVWKTSIVYSVPRNIEPGKVISITQYGAIVKCGEHAICLEECDLGFQTDEGAYL